jgi:hypothetical protein
MKIHADADGIGLMERVKRLLKHYSPVHYKEGFIIVHSLDLDRYMDNDWVPEDTDDAHPPTKTVRQAIRELPLVKDVVAIWDSESLSDFIGKVHFREDWHK